MSCSNCGGETIAFPVAENLRQYLPDGTVGASLCRSCLTMDPVDDPPGEMPDLTALDDGFPSNPDAAVPMALLVGLLDSLALNRQEITALLERVERAGTDPLLVIDRLDDAFGDEAFVDLGARRHQLAQLL